MGSPFLMRGEKNLSFFFIMFFGALVFPFLISSEAFFIIGGVQVHHLTPNSILHISIFVHLCEAYIGIEPHFNLFQHLFHLKPQPNATTIDVVGGAGLQLCQGVGLKYIRYKLTSKVIDWKNFWFYMKNQAPALPLRTLGPPISNSVGIRKEIILPRLMIFLARQII